MPKRVPLYALLAGMMPAAQAVELADLSLEQLLAIPITSVSKKPEPLNAAAASVFVITAEDIRRSGFTTLPDVLRLAPNLHVAQGSASGYAISARGMNGSNNSAPNKLQVLVDGRSVYTPLFSGVFWDVQDLLLEDIERIEVISGPGGTLWGTNAVNGVINIITRSAHAPAGNLASASVASDGATAGVRLRAKLGAGANMRLWAKFLDRRATRTEDGTQVNDAWHSRQLGLRADIDRPWGQLSLHAKLYEAVEDQPEPGAINIEGTGLQLGTVNDSGGNLMARWSNTLQGGSLLSVQAAVDHRERSVPPTFSQVLDLLDIQLMQQLRFNDNHALSWGLDYRHSWDRVNNNSPYFAFLPAEVEQDWASLFLQGELGLTPAWRLILGARAEHNDYTGMEYLPNVRLAWTPGKDHTLWSAVSRGVRSPSRLDVDAYVPAQPPYLLDGGPDVRSETAWVYEIGYRARPTSTVDYSLTLFHAVYDHLRTQEIAPSMTYLTFGSGMQGKSSGMEWWGRWQVTPDWRMSAGFTALKEEFRLKPGSNDTAGPASSGKNPDTTWQLRSMHALSDTQEFDVAVRHVASLRQFELPAYTTLDLRWGWSMQPGLTLALGGRNLLGKHAEYGPRATRSEFEPEVFASLSWTR